MKHSTSPLVGVMRAARWSYNALLQKIFLRAG